MSNRMKAITPAFPGLPTEMVFKILTDLDTRSLLNCRQVSRGWCQVASTILQSRPTVVVRPICRPHLWKKNRSLASFIKCFKNSRKFRHPVPFANFVLREFDGNVSDCPNLEPFFDLSKQSNSRHPGCTLLIKCLRFDHIQPSQPLDNLMRLICEGASNIRKLSLNFDRYSHAQSTDREEVTGQGSQASSSSSYRTRPVPEGMIFPSLQVLQLFDCVGEAAMEFVSKIVGAAPKLQRIEGTDVSGFEERHYCVHHPDHLQVLINTKKLHLVNQCWIQLNKTLATSGVLVRDRLSGFQPASLQVENLNRSTNVRSEWVQNLEQIKAALMEILWTVKDSLEKLRIDDSLSILEDPENVPVFSKLKMLHWSLKSKGYGILPREFRNGHVFKKVEKIYVSFPETEGNHRIFPKIGRIPEIPSVHTLQIHACGTQVRECLESMTPMCPNVRNLEFSYAVYNMDAGFLGPLIWNMRKLKNLTLNIDSMFLGRRVSPEVMETWFTGFSLETVQRIKAGNLKNQPKVESVDKLRVNPSILKLTELEKLCINMADGSQAATFALSAKYAFDLMPGLVVQISSS